MSTTDITIFAEGITANVTEDPQVVQQGATPAEKVAIAVILGFFSIFGTFGNGLVLYVFTRKSDKVTSTIFILALAWTDLFTCMVIVPFTVVSVQTDSYLVYDAVCKIYQFLITFNVPLSSFIMVAIAVDRYFSICHPFLHAVTPRRARISILCLCLFAFTIGTITACMHGVYGEGQETVTVNRGEADWCPNITNPGLYSDDDIMAITTRSPIDPSPAVVYIDDGGSTIRPYNQALEIIINDNSVYTPDCSRNESKMIYFGGECRVNMQLFSAATVGIYSIVQASFYAISLLLVFTLYFFIYRSVVRRRAWRRKQKSWSHSPMAATTSPAPDSNKNSSSKSTKTTPENMELIRKNENGNDAHNTQTVDGERNGSKKGAVENGKSNNGMSSAEKKASRERRDFNFLANIRTAGMLFVVSIVFIFSFLPAWLMACRLIPFKFVIFYMYFLYNTANPVIYAFMNQSFRKELKRVFQRGTHFLRNG